MDEGLSEYGGGPRHGEAGERRGVDAGDFVELIGAAVVADVVVEEGSEGGAAEFQTGVEGSLNDARRADCSWAEQKAGLNEQAEVLGGCGEGESPRADGVLIRHGDSGAHGDSSLAEPMLWTALAKPGVRPGCKNRYTIFMR